eukprot:2492114-Amphidinium_carterae.2
MWLLWRLAGPVLKPTQKNLSVLCTLLQAPGPISSTVRTGLTIRDYLRTKYATKIKPRHGNLLSVRKLGDPPAPASVATVER